MQRFQKVVSVRLLDDAALAGAAQYLSRLVQELEYFHGLGARLLSAGVSGRVVEQLRVWLRTAHPESGHEELDAGGEEEEAEAEERGGGAAGASEDDTDAAIASIGGLALSELQERTQQLRGLLSANSGALAELAAWERVLEDDKLFHELVAELDLNVLADFDDLSAEQKAEALQWRMLFGTQEYPTVPTDGSVGVALAAAIRLLDASRVTATPNQATKLNADPPSDVKEPQKTRLLLNVHDGTQRVDALQSTLGRPWDLSTLLPASSSATRSHAVRMRPGAQLPSAFTTDDGRSSVQEVPAAASVAEAVKAVEARGARVEARAKTMGLRKKTQRELRRAVKACHVLAARGALQVGRLRARLLRVEMYADDEPANGSTHDAAVSRLPFSGMPKGAVYFQKYAGGFGWGLNIRGEGKTNFLVRAVHIKGRGELGMTKFARLVAKKLGVTIQVNKS